MSLKTGWDYLEADIIVLHSHQNPQQINEALSCEGRLYPRQYNNAIFS